MMKFQVLAIYGYTGRLQKKNIILHLEDIIQLENVFLKS